MYCPNCGWYNDENAAFCGSCGTPLRTEQSGREQPGQTAGAVPPYPGGQEMKRMEGGAPIPPVQKKKKGKKIWLILAAVLVVIAAAMAAVFLWILPQQKVKQYNSLVAEGNRYLEEMDYEKAEDAFLEAIEIEPKKAEPYVRLADLYLDTGETEKAKQIITEAKETLPEEEREEIEKLEEERKDELDGEEPVEEEEVEEELPFDQEYWVIFREGFRENRIEMSTVDSDMDRQDLCIIWDAGQRWLVNVEVYQDGNFVAGAAVDRDTKEPIRNIYNYNP